MAASNRILGAVALLLLADPAVAAKPAVPEPSGHLNAIGACRSIAADPARLACFDREAAALVAAAGSGELSIVNRSEMKAARRSMFGFALPKLPFFSGDKSADDASDQLESTIRTVRAVENGRFRLTLAEGDAVWETTESPARLGVPEAGDKIVIRKAALGSYFLRIGGRVGVKGQRVK